MGWGDIFSKVATAVLGSLASGLVSQGLNAAFSPSQPSRRDVQRDLQMQAQAMQQAAQPVRTPEQEKADQMALEATRARQATFSNLSQEYAGLQKAGPQVFWNPYEEQRIKEEAMAEAAIRGMGESGQAQQHVARRLDEARLNRSQAASQLHEQKLSNLRTQMAAYSGVERPGSPPLSPTPSVAPLPRTTEPLFKASPVDIAAILAPEKERPEAKGQTPPQGALGYQPPEPPSPQKRQEQEYLNTWRGV